MKAALPNHRSFICNYQGLTYHLPTFKTPYTPICITFLKMLSSQTALLTVWGLTCMHFFGRRVVFLTLQACIMTAWCFLVENYKTEVSPTNCGFTTYLSVNGQSWQWMIHLNLLLLLNIQPLWWTMYYTFLVVSSIHKILALVTLYRKEQERKRKETIS